MNYFISSFGLFIAAIALYMFVYPEKAIEYFRQSSDSKFLYILAIIVKLFMGSLMYFSADHTRFPEIIRIIGIAAFIAGIFLLLITRSRFEKMFLSSIDYFSKYVRYIAVFAVFFGGFLIYAAYS